MYKYYDTDVFDRDDMWHHVTRRTLIRRVQSNPLQLTEIFRM